MADKAKRVVAYASIPFFLYLIAALVGASPSPVSGNGLGSNIKMPGRDSDPAASASASEGQWVLQGTFPQNNAILQSASFVDNRTGWVVG